MRKKVIISIIIPCFNAKKHIKRCFDSILRSKFPSFEVIVVDDGSTDSSVKLVKELTSSRVKLIENKKNLGPARARNIGAKKSQGRYLLFLDVDTEIKKDCLKAIVNKFEEDKKIGAIQANLDTAGHFLSYFGFPYEIKAEKKEKLIFGASTAGMGIRKKLFEKIKGFDEDYLIYGEDTDLSWRIWLTGYQVLYLPQAKAYHFQKSSLNPETKYRVFYEGAKNNTSNILKNAPLKVLIWMLPFHLLAWFFLSLKLIIQRRLTMALWIYKGLGWNLKNLDKVLRKRKKVASYTAKNNQATKIMLGKQSPKNLLAKGWRWFRNV